MSLLFVMGIPTSPDSQRFLQASLREMPFVEVDKDMAYKLNIIIERSIQQPHIVTSIE